MHYLDTDDSTLAANAAHRNASRNETAAYYVDDSLMKKCNSVFEPLLNDESDVIRIDGITQRAYH